MKARTVSHIVSFLEALASERGASVNTIDAYRRDLADYEAYLKAQGIEALKADTNHVRGFLTARGAQKLSAASTTFIETAWCPSTSPKAAVWCQKLSAGSM